MKCPEEEEERGQEAGVDDPGFSSAGPGQSKLAGSRRSCHFFPPATEPSAASAPRHGRDPRLPATSSEARGGTRAPRQTQELGGGRGPAQTRVRPPLLSHQETPGMLCQEPGPTDRKPFAFLPTRPNGEATALAASGRGKKSEELIHLMWLHFLSC